MAKLKKELNSREIVPCVIHDGAEFKKSGRARCDDYALNICSVLATYHAGSEAFNISKILSTIGVSMVNYNYERSFYWFTPVVHDIIIVC